MHGLTWNMLGLFSLLFPRQMARQTLAIFSTHDPDDALRQLSESDVQTICHFYQRKSSRVGAVNDAAHMVGKDLLQAVPMPTLVIHSREDRAVPFEHAEWSIQHIPTAALFESGCTGHFFWVGPDQAATNQKLVSFLKGEDNKGERL
jgi:pimeloyl-ACP methyl ester carboxylesterase